MRSVSLVLLLVLSSAAALCQEYEPRYLEIAEPSGLVDLYVDPTSGSDSKSGAAPSQALRTLSAAWNLIPQGSPLAHGYRINLAPGTYPEESLPNYFESRYGTANAPIIIRSAGAAGTAILGGDINMFDCRYISIIGVTIRPEPAGDAFHCEQCSRILLRGSTFDGGARAAHETIKFNQSTDIFLENNDIHGADDNAVDFVAVQRGHLIGNRIHDAGDWCAYVKGGSAQIRLENNRFYDCGTGGFTAGQGTGFEFMTPPWLHYEAYDIKFFNNIVHDTEGAAIGINGGYNILMAFNTFYRVGRRSHAIEVVFGGRSCDGDAARCGAHRALGGWGATVGEEPIPNRRVVIANNIVFNPPGFRSADQHFAIYGPRTPTAGTGIAAPARTDTDLLIQGNILWNGPADLPLGIEGSGACVDANPTCSESQLRRDNAINAVEPRFIDPAAGDFRPAPQSDLLTYAAAAIADFSDIGRPEIPTVPVGVLRNTITLDRGGRTRLTNDPPGAYRASDSPLVGPLPDDSIPGTPGDAPANRAPTLSIVRLTAISGRTIRIAASVRARDVDGQIERVTARIVRNGSTTKRFALRRITADVFRGTTHTRSFRGSFRVTVRAIDNRGAAIERTRRVRAP